MTYISFMGHSCAPFCIPNSIQLNPLLGESFFLLIQTKQKIIFQNRRLVVYIHSYLVLRKLSKKHCSLCTSESAESRVRKTAAWRGRIRRQIFLNKGLCSGMASSSSLISGCQTFFFFFLFLDLHLLLLQIYLTKQTALGSWNTLKGLPPSPGAQPSCWHICSSSDTRCLSENHTVSSLVRDWIPAAPTAAAQTSINFIKQLCKEAAERKR